VELNNFPEHEGEGTHAELFNWEKDDAILKGVAPFEFRLLEEPLSVEALKKTLTKPYRIWMGWEKESSYNPAIDHV